MESSNMYIINLNTFTTILIDFLPDAITDSIGATFSSQPIMGRSSPIFGYAESGPRDVSFSVLLHDDYCVSGIEAEVAKYKALVYPFYGGNTIEPKCMVRLGNMVSFMGFCKEVGVNWSPPIRNGVYVKAEINLSFTAVYKNPLSTEEVESGNDNY